MENTVMVINKKWYTSKTIWVNGIALAAAVITSVTGHAISSEIQLAILGAINIGLRSITKENITW